RPRAELDEPVVEHGRAEAALPREVRAHSRHRTRGPRRSVGGSISARRRLWSSGRDRPGPQQLAGGSAVAELVDRDGGGVDVEGVERLGLDDLEVVEGGEADGDVGDVAGRSDLTGDVALDPVEGALADL